MKATPRFQQEALTVPRPNRARSGGPKTAAGRAVGTHNALKTGAYAMQAVLPGEDPAQFAELERQLVHDFEPVGAAEAAMVHDLAILTWKKLRIDRVEHAVMMQLIRQPLTHDRIEKSFGPDFLPEAMPRLVPLNPVTQQEFDEAAALPDSNEGKHLVLWLWQHRERVQAALNRAQDSKLLEYMKVDNTRRAHQDTARAFYRTLAELRQQQTRRPRPHNASATPPPPFVIADSIRNPCPMDPGSSPG